MGGACLRPAGRVFSNCQLVWLWVSSVFVPFPHPPAVSIFAATAPRRRGLGSWRRRLLVWLSDRYKHGGRDARAGGRCGWRRRWYPCDGW